MPYGIENINAYLLKLTVIFSFDLKLYNITQHITLFLAQESIILSEWLKSRIIHTTDLDKVKRPFVQGKPLGRIQRKDSIKKINNTSLTLKPSKTLQTKLSPHDIEYDSDESFSEDKRLYSTVNNEYITRVNEIMSVPNAFGINYLFELQNVISDVLTLEESLFKPNEKIARKISRLSKMKISSKSVDAALSKEMVSTKSIERLKDEMLVPKFNF